MNLTYEVSPPADSITITIIILYFTVLVENIAVCILIVKKNVMAKHSIYVALISLSLSDSLFCLNGISYITIVLYVTSASGNEVSPALCTFVLFLMFHIPLISSSQLVLINIMRTVSLYSIGRNPDLSKIFTKRKTIFFVFFIWILLTSGWAIVIMVEHTVYDVTPVYCRFRSLIAMFKITTKYFFVMSSFNTSASLLLYALSIFKLVHLYLNRKKIGVSQEVESVSVTQASNMKHIIENKTEHVSSNYKTEQEVIDIRQREASTAFGHNSNNFTVSRGGRGNNADPAVTKKRQNKELIATIIVGILILTHSATSIPTMIQLENLIRDPESIVNLYITGILSILHAFTDPFMFILSLPSIRERLACNCPNKFNIMK